MAINSSCFFSPNDNIPGFVFPALVCLSTMVLVICLPLNSYVFWLILTNARNRLATEFFSLNLCVCEIIISFCALPNIVNVICFKIDEESPLLYSLLVLSCLHNISRPFFQCCVCVERYVAVIYPVIFLKYRPVTYRIACSGVTWIIILGISVLSIHLLYRNTIYYILLPEYIITCAVKILCSIAVLKALSKPKPGEKLAVSDLESNRMKRKAFWLILIILVFMILTYFPMMIFISLLDFLPKTEKWKYMTMIFYLIIFSGFAHPVLYLHRAGKLSFIPCF